MKVFGLAGIDFYKNYYEYEYEYTNTDPTLQSLNMRRNTTEKGFNIHGSIGFGVALFGRAGNIETHVSNAELYIGFHKKISGSK